MTAMQAYLWMAFGVLISVIFPIIKAAVAPKTTESVGLPPWVKKYALIFVFAAVTAVIVLAAYLAANPEALKTLQWYTAFLFGFSWESAIEKITAPPR
jgi:hypothetical protein